MTDENEKQLNNAQKPVSKNAKPSRENNAQRENESSETQSVIVDKFKELSEKTGLNPKALFGIIAAVVIVLLLLSLSMCGKDEEEANNASSPGAISNQDDVKLGDEGGSVGSGSNNGGDTNDNKIVGSNDESEDDSDSESASDSDDQDGNVNQRGSTLEDRPAFLNEDVDPDQYAPEGTPAPVNEELDARAEEVLPILDTIVNDPTFNDEGFEELKSKLNKKGLEPGPNIEFAYRSGQQYEDGGAMFESRSFKPAFYATSQPGVYEATYEVAAGALPNVSANPQDEDETRNRMRGELDAMIGTGVAVPLKFTIDLNAGSVEADSNMWWAM